MCDFTTLSRVERVQFSPSPRRADAACLENRGLTATTLIYAGHGVFTEWRTRRTRHRAGVFNEPFAVSPIETANGSHD